jgi:molecular chaperone DnaK
MKAIGIDYGTTNSVMSYINDHGQPEVIANAEGSRLTPSVFAITEDKNKIVGKPAIDQEGDNPLNTIRSIKRQMGTSNRLIIKDFTLSPEEISSEILKKLKHDAEEYLGEKIEKAVITVPAYFNNDQRQSTKIAGELAGFEVLRIINEPTAASLAYGLEQKKNETVLVFDLGGGTFDVTILDITNDGIFDVKSTSGDTHLGGDDFDQIFVKIFVDKLHGLYPNHVNIPFDATETVRLREAAEQIKIQLSSTNSAVVNLPYIAFDKGQPFSLKSTILRTEFEEHPETKELLTQIKNCVDLALKDAKLTKDDIDEVVFVGGSTRVPLVAQSVETWIGKKPNKSVNPDEAVAIGAAIQAAILTGQREKDILLLDVTPLSLGIETLGGVMTTMIKRNTTIPTEYDDIFTTAEDDQDKVTVRIYQGERPQVKNNKFLGELVLGEILPAPRGVPQIKVVFEIDANGILSVHAKDQITEKEQKATITGSSSLSGDEIQKIVQDAEKFAAEDKLFKDLSDIKNTLQMQLLQIESILRESEEDLTNELLVELGNSINNIENNINSEDIELLTNISNNIKNIIETTSELIYKKADELIGGD